MDGLMNVKTETRTTQMWSGMIDGLPKIEQRRLEEIDNIVISSTGTPWAYLPVGPFQVQMCHQSGRPELSSWTVLPTLDLAVSELVRIALPPRQGFVVEVVDETFRQVLGATYHDDAWEHGGGWFGCQAAFVELREHTDAVSVAVWEEIARYTAPGGGRS